VVAGVSATSTVYVVGSVGAGVTVTVSAGLAATSSEARMALASGSLARPTSQPIKRAESIIMRAKPASLFLIFILLYYKDPSFMGGSAMDLSF